MKNPPNLSKLLTAQSQEDWDGYGGLPAMPGAVEAAGDFIRALPSEITQPEVAVDPGGQISLEWFGAKDRIFSICISDRGRVAYAGIDATDRWRSAEMFEGNSIHPVSSDGDSARYLMSMLTAIA